MGENAKNYHEGHRERLRNRFKLESSESFQDHELLEMFLFDIIPRRNTNDIAHALIERFGSLGGVFDATMDELCQVDGIGAKTAEYLCRTGTLLRVLSLQEEIDARDTTEKPEYKEPKDCFRLVKDWLLHEHTKGLWIFAFDGLYHVFDTEFIQSGPVSGWKPKKVIRAALEAAISANPEYILALIVTESDTLNNEDDMKENMLCFFDELMESCENIGVPVIDSVLVFDDGGGDFRIYSYQTEFEEPDD